MKTENFIKKINEIKEKNSLDLTIIEDLSIALMNLISLEEHAYFSFVKTHNKKFLDIIESTRELRKELLELIVKKDDDSEKWCISKHLLASSIRLIEIGNRFLHEKKEKEAEEFYEKAAELYGMFFRVNSNEKMRNIKINKNEKKGIFAKIKYLLKCCIE